MNRGQLRQARDGSRMDGDLIAPGNPDAAALRDAFDPIVRHAAPRRACRSASAWTSTSIGTSLAAARRLARARLNAGLTTSTIRDTYGRYRSTSHSIIGRPLTGTRNFGVLVCRREPAPAAGMIRSGSLSARCGRSRPPLVGRSRDAASPAPSPVDRAGGRASRPLTSAPATAVLRRRSCVSPARVKSGRTAPGSRESPPFAAGAGPADADSRACGSAARQCSAHRRLGSRAPPTACPRCSGRTARGTPGSARGCPTALIAPKSGVFW